MRAQEGRLLAFPAVAQESDRLRLDLAWEEVSPAIMARVSESLVGRLALVELTPFTLSELRGVSLARHWGRAGYPDGGVRGGPRYPT